MRDNNDDDDGNNKMMMMMIVLVIMRIMNLTFLLQSLHNNYFNVVSP